MIGILNTSGEFYYAIFGNIQLPLTKIVFNRFYVMKHVNEVVDKTRKYENKKKLKNKGLIELNRTRYKWLY